MDTVTDERVRFEESFAFGAGKPLKIPAIGVEDESSRVVFLTDGFGPGPAFEQVAEWGKGLPDESLSPLLEAHASIGLVSNSDGGSEAEGESPDRVESGQ